MTKIGLLWKFTLFLILAMIATDVFVVYLIYKQNGHLPKVLIVVMTITCIICCSVILIFGHLLRRYYMNQEAKHKKDDEQ